MAVWDEGSSITTRDARGIFAKMFLIKVAQLAYPELCEVVDSTRLSEFYAAIGSVPQMEELDDERIFEGYTEYEKTINNLEYSAGLRVRRKLVLADQVGQTRKLLQAFGARIANHPDKLMFQMIVANPLAIDGVAFFSDSHALGAQAIDNIVTGTLTAAEILADDVKTSAKAFQNDFKNAITQLENMVDDRGEPLHPNGINEKDCVAVVPTALKWVARTALGASMLDTTTNVFEGQVKKIISVPSAYLSSRCDWYLAHTGDPMKPILFQRFRPKKSSEFLDQLPEGFDESLVAQMQTILLETVWRDGENVSSHTLLKQEYLISAYAMYTMQPGDFREIVKVDNTE